MGRSQGIEVLSTDLYGQGQYRTSLGFFHGSRHFERISPKVLNERLIKTSRDKLAVGTDVWLSTELLTRRTWHPVITKSEPYEFVDTISQDKIFKEWSHTHRFEQLDNNTTSITDEITFECRYGVIGKIAEWYMLSKLCGVFAYRSEKLVEIFNDSEQAGE